MEPEVVLPVIVEVEEIGAGVDGAAAFVVSREQMLQSVLDFLRHVPQMHVLARAGGTFDLQRVAVEHVEAQEGLDKQEVYAKPHGTAPVAVAAEKGAVRFTGYVADFEGLAVDIHGIGVFFVVFRHRPDAVLGKEFCLVQHTFQNLFEPLSADEGEEESVVFAAVLHAGDVTLDYILLVLDEPVQSLSEGWELVDKIGFEG